MNAERERERADIPVRDEDSARHADVVREQIQSASESEEETAAADFCVGNDR